jgi:hypothetical protein
MGTTDSLRQQYAPGQRLQVLWKEGVDGETEHLVEELRQFTAEVKVLRSFNNLAVLTLSQEVCC